MGLFSKCKFWLCSFLTICLLIPIIPSQTHSFPAREMTTLNEDTKDQDNLGKSPAKHLLLVLVPQLSFADIPNLLNELNPAIQRDFRLSAMSMRTAGGMNLHNNLLTLSTGQPALGLAGWTAFHQEEEFQGELVQDKYSQWSGKHSTAPILHPAIFQLTQYWQQQGLALDMLGWFGQELADQGIYTAAFGNSDTLDKKQRLAPTFAMNTKGEAQGIVDEQILSTDSYFPTGKKTDWQTLSTELKAVWTEQRRSLITVELGDLERFYAEQDKMELSHAEQVRQSWYQEWARWLEDVVSLTERSHIPAEIWIVSPMVSTEARQQGKMLAPFLTWSNGQGHGLLTSVTTKQDGIITNLDLLPSICAYFDLEPQQFNQPKQLVGKAIQPSSSEDIQTWINHLDYLFLIYKARRDVITTYISIVICLLLLTTGYWWWGRTKRRATQGVRIAIGGILLSPLYYLWLTPLINWFKPWQWITILLLLSILSSWLVHLFCRNDALYLAVLGLVNTVFIISDLIQGSPQMKRSFLGYDPIVGARFYGIGNEYSGFLLGSSLLAVIACMVWLTRQGVFSGSQGQVNKYIYLGATVLIYTGIIYLLAAPQYGTNLGATLASVGTYALLLITLFSLGWNWKWIIGSLVSIILLLAAFLYSHLSAEHTHLGAALALILAGDWDMFFDIVRRKWEMNMRLIRVSLWGKLFVTSLFVLVVVLFKLKKKRKLVHPDLWFQGFRVIVLGSILILLVNDSGIVAAATTMLYVTFPFLYLRFSEQKFSENYPPDML